MIDLAGFRIISAIYRSNTTRVYRARREADGLAVILKAPGRDRPAPSEIAAYEREYAIIRSLDPGGVIRCHGLESHGRSAAIVLEDFGAESLKDRMARKRFSLEEALVVGIKTAAGIEQIHAAGVIHKDINPSNIVMNPETGVLKLIDFGISTVFLRESPTFKNPNILKGTLAYISPEQTGRMNRDLDYRTDFYSFGATLYELLTGRVPFEAKDPMELVYCHIAKEPPAPHAVNPKIPPALSAIVMKLLEKNAEERYRSARGIRTDLEGCLRQLRANGEIRGLDPGRGDVSDRLQIPQKLYGRREEVKSLLDSFERICPVPSPSGDTESKRREVVLVSGYSGIGKTMLVREVQKPITRSRGRFISGKFDQIQEGIPYSALAGALRELVHDLLAESELDLSAWKRRLIDALGPNGRLILEIVPDLELIIGPQPEVSDLPPVESRNRFRITIQSFLAALAGSGRPLVLFLDDLQWADAASLQLIEFFITGPASDNLLLIGAYRENEVGPAHPLMETIEAIRKSSTPVCSIHMNPLGLRDITALVADSLRSTPSDSLPLAEVVLAKTDGNPFFVNEFLRYLFGSGLLAFDRDGGIWTWNMEGIQAARMTENVVELLAKRLLGLSAEERKIAGVGACIGNRFDSEILAAVCGEPQPGILEMLRLLSLEGLLFPAGDAHLLQYRFCHDRIQQAAASLIGEEEKQRVHLEVGRLLLKDAHREDRERRIADIVNHLNQGCAFMESRPELDELARLNLEAGRKAKASAAYAAALRYLKTGIGLLESDAWEKQYELCLDLTTEAAEAAFLGTAMDEMAFFIASVEEHARSALDAAKAREVKVCGKIAQNRLAEAVQTALDTLDGLGVELPRNPGLPTVMIALLGTRLRLMGKPAEKLMELPPMTDRNKVAAMRIMGIAGPSAYRSNPNQMAVIVTRMVELSIKFGNSPSSALAYMSYGMVLCGAFGALDSGYAFGKLALDMIARSEATEHKACITLVFATFIQPWKEPLARSIEGYLKSFRLGLETGDLDIATLGAAGYCSDMFFTGEELEGLEKKLAKYAQTVENLKHHASLCAIRFSRQIVQNMMGRSEKPYVLDGECFREKTGLPELIEAGDLTWVFVAYVDKLMLCYFFGEYREGHAAAKEARKYMESAQSTFHFGLFHFWDCLNLLALYPRASAGERRRILRSVAAYRKKLKKWAANCPANFMHRLYLVEAERARVRGRAALALECYEQAMERAAENGFPPEEALANELAGVFCLEQAKKRKATAYLSDARYGYLRWGAKAKVNDLDKRFPWLAHPTANPSTSEKTATAEHSPVFTSSTSGEYASDTLDLTSVVRASRALSGRIDPEELLRDLMRIVMESAGAGKGFLVLKQGEELRVEAAWGAWGEAGCVLRSVLLDECLDLSAAIVHYVARSKESVILADAAREDRFAGDEYIQRSRPLSVLCIPILHQGSLTGVLYLENNLATGAFSPARVRVLRLLASQGAVSIENVRLYSSLKAREEEYRTLFENLSAGVFRASGAESLRFLKVNPAFVKITGAGSTEELMKSSLADFYADPDEKKRVMENMMEQGFAQNVACRLKRVDGTIIWVSLTAKATLDPDGSLKWLDGIVEDITGGKEAEEELDRYREHLEDLVEKRTQDLRLAKQEADSANRAKGDFLAHVSHEIRTPMNAIIGMSQLAMQTEPTPKQRDYLSKIETSARSLLGIINDILDFSKIEAGKLEMEQIDFMPGEVLDRVSGLVTLRAEEKGLKVLFSVESSVPRYLVGDPLRLGQVLMNLMSNAVKFTEKGEITVTVDRKDTPGSRPGDAVRLKLSVRDTGIGLSAEEQERIFKPFSQADGSTTRKYGGTGLGLAICRRLVEMMDGTIWVESEPGKGSTFIFTAAFGLSEKHRNPVPLSGKQVNPPTSCSLPAEIRGARVLLVEDNAINRQVATEILEAYGIRVSSAANGREGVEAALSGAYDLVFMDIQMPEMDGLEATRIIRSSSGLKDLPIVAMTAHAMAGDMEKSLDAGMNGHITKPIDPNEVHAALLRFISPGIRKAPGMNPEREDAARPAGFPDLPGIDVSDGLKRVAGNKRVYVKILEEFLSAYCDAASSLRSDMDAGRLDEAAKVVHTIKGVAGNIGARDLFKTASDLESAINKGDIEGAWKAHAAFEQALSVVKSASAVIEKAYREKSLKRSLSGKLDIASAGDLVEEMAPLIAGNNLRARDMVGDLRAALAGAGLDGELDRLEGHLDEFHFKDALVVLDEIKAGLARMEE